MFATLGKGLNRGGGGGGNSPAEKWWTNMNNEMLLESRLSVSPNVTALSPECQTHEPSTSATATGAGDNKINRRPTIPRTKVAVDEYFNTRSTMPDFLQVQDRHNGVVNNETSVGHEDHDHGHDDEHEAPSRPDGDEQLSDTQQQQQQQQQQHNYNDDITLSATPSGASLPSSANFSFTVSVFEVNIFFYCFVIVTFLSCRS